MEKIEAQGFWRWAFSDFMSNALRAILAEYIVACAMNCTHRARTEWDAYDLKTPDGTKIEVKSSAYLQSWQQKQHSTIRFDIAPKKAWDSETNTSLKHAVRSAHVYVFCVFAAMDKATADPLDLSQWFFLACSSRFLNERFGVQKSVALSSLEQQGLSRLSFNELPSAIEQNKS